MAGQAGRAGDHLPAAADRPARQAQFDAYQASEGQPLADWALWCALAEQHGPDWRTWPQPASWARPRDARPGPANRAGQLLRLDPVARSTTSSPTLPSPRCPGGLRVCVIRGPCGGRAIRAARMPGPAGHAGRRGSVGAPPDGFNQLGQDWSQPPWHPERLAGRRYAPLADLFRAALQHAGGVRVDHVMGLMRLPRTSPRHAARPGRLRSLRPPADRRRADLRGG